MIIMGLIEDVAAMTSIQGGEVRGEGFVVEGVEGMTMTIEAVVGDMGIGTITEIGIGMMIGGVHLGDGGVGQGVHLQEVDLEGEGSGETRSLTAHQGGLQ